MSDVNVIITEAEPINIIITEEQPINVTIEKVISSTLDSVFTPDEDGHRVIKIYIKDGKLKIKYESGD